MDEERNERVTVLKERTERALWIQGWMEALSKVRDRLVDLQTGSADPETQKQITALFNSVKELEKASLSYAPTLSARLDTE